MKKKTEWITTGEAASLIGMSRDTVLRLIADKRLKARRPRREWQVCKASVRKYLKSMESVA